MTKPIGRFKYKEDTVFYIYFFNKDFFCQLNWDIDWNSFEKYQKEGIGDVLKLIHTAKTIEEAKEICAAVNGNFHFEWEV